ncbi:MAG: hypothetical protein H7A36_07360 [Chlamydiales bacterium]|nr:hypothetical protein [Chlamydiales bacterium]
MRRNSFTLLELLCVLTLIAFVLGTGGIQMKRALSGERFERAVEQIERKLELAQEIMLDCNTDVIVTFETGEKGVVCQLHTLKPLPKRWRRFLTVNLKEVNAISFDGERVQKLELTYDSALGACPCGHLLIQGKKRVRMLTLPNYPGKIKKGVSDEKGIFVPYPQEVLSLT